jgi:hypothetical protein
MLFKCAEIAIKLHIILHLHLYQLFYLENSVYLR